MKKIDRLTFIKNIAIPGVCAIAAESVAANNKETNKILSSEVGDTSQLLTNDEKRLFDQCVSEAANIVDSQFCDCTISVCSKHQEYDHCGVWPIGFFHIVDKNGVHHMLTYELPATVRKFKITEFSSNRLLQLNHDIAVVLYETANKILKNV